MSSTLKDIQRHIENELPPIASEKRLLAGSIGESPSKYSRSPGMWNATFGALDFDAAYVPFDVPLERLRAFVSALRTYPGFMGANVTVPHKLAIMELLDDIDPRAREIGAVNTFALNEDGRLVGYNTDADGLIASIIKPLPGQDQPFLDSLAGKHALLLGAGGAGRASAFALGRNLDGGTLTIANRSIERATELANQVMRATGSFTSAISSQEALDAATSADLIVNATTVGQSGIKHLGDANATSLEAFSSLAPSEPAIVADSPDPSDFWSNWFRQSADAIAENNLRSSQSIAACKPDAAFVDAVYSPDETVLLRQARLSGRKTLNGKGMLIMQAAYSFVNRMTRRHLHAAGHDPDALHELVVTTMADAF